jgi:alkanesulfonate monooxygenase SsuD/methylene tetrahydromethanopterin reductase-like flavin-dependent oxidoreductase (luciferase family)
MEFGIFDHLDRNSLPLADYFEERLEIIEALDRAGFYSYHLAEHHATPLGMAPSPSVFLSAVAQRTKRMRFGPLIYALPLYHPLRMIEEICMLDQMSGGRLDMGFGRGASPIELDLYGTDPAQSREIYDEALAIIMQGLAGGALTFRGKHFNFEQVPIEIEPVQKPHPPLWYGTHAPESAARCARAGINAVTLDSVTQSRTYSDAFRAAWAETGRPVEAIPKFGLGRFVVVADTDSEAWRIARDGYPMWHQSFTHLFRMYGRRVPSHPRPPTFNEIAADGRAIAGSPARVTHVIRQQMTAAGADYFVGQFAFGDIPRAETLRSIELFAQEVMPKLRNGQGRFDPPGKDG